VVILQKKLFFNFGPHIISVTSPTFSFQIIPSYQEHLRALNGS